MPFRELAAVYDPDSRANADWIVRRDRARFVIDGASSLRGETIEGLSSAAWLARELGAALATVPLADLENALRPRVEAIARRARELVGDEAGTDLPFCCLIGCIEHDDVVELVGWGDCQALIFEEGAGRAELFGCCSVAQLDDAVLAAVLADKRDGHSHAQAFERSFARIEANRERRNRDAGYQIVDLRPPYLGIPERRFLDKRCARRIVLTTDGLMRAHAAYSLIELAEFARIATQAELDALLARTRAVEREDAACERYPRLKPADDVAALVVDFAGAEGHDE